MRWILLIRRPTACVLLVLFASGCYTWRERRVEPATYIAQEAPGTIRIDIAEPNGTTRYMVRNPTVSHDSLRGSFMIASRGQWRPLVTPGIPVDLVQQPFKVRQFSIKKLILGVLGGLAALLVLFGAAYAADPLYS
jgi:hypothetical protein